MSSEQFQYQSRPTLAGEDLETVVDRLMRRMQALEEDKQWWKRAALITFALFLLAFIGGAVLTVGGGVMYFTAIERQEDQIRSMEVMRAQQAQQQAEVARQEAEQARLQAVQAQAEADRLAAEIARQRLKELERQNK